MKKLESVIIGSDSPKASVIWLHGLGANGHDFVSVVPMLNLPKGPFRFVFPHAPNMPVTLNNGMEMPAWFDIDNFNFDSHTDETGIKQASGWIEDLINDELAIGLETHQILLVGYSQGGALALYTALRYSKPLAGCAGLSTYLPKLKRLINDETVNRGLEIFLAHGKYDDVVPFQLGQQCFEELQKHACPVEFHAYNMGHQVCAEELDRLGQWMARCAKI